MTVRPRSTTEPSGGLVSITWPAGTEPEYWRCCSDSKPASVSFAAASSGDSPLTAGTVLSPGPLETVICTVEPSLAWAPGSGFCPATRPSSTVSDWIGTTSTSKPRFWISCAALAEVWPTTFGTGSSPGRSSSHRPSASAASATTTTAMMAIRRQLRSSSDSSSTTGSSGGTIGTPRRACSSAARNSSALWKRARRVLLQRAHDDRVERRRHAGIVLAAAEPAARTPA